jgi:hypothetical protein
MIVAPAVIMRVVMAVTPVSAAFGLEGSAHVHKIRSQAMQHLFDHMVRPNAKDLASNFSRQMPISQMPGKTRKLTGILMPDLDNELGSGLNLQQPSIVKLQTVSISHGNRLRKVEKHIFALVRGQANATAMARVEIERDGACRLFLRPMPGDAVN